MADQATSGELANRTVVANYVATMSTWRPCRPISPSMARRSGLDTLGYLLEMIRLEAESETRHKPNSGR